MHAEELAYFKSKRIRDKTRYVLKQREGGR